MIYKLQNGGIIKLQKAGSLPKWMQKLNSWSIPDSDESAGERILNSTIEQANKASTQEERDQIYKDSAKKNLAVTGQSLMMLPILGEFTTYGLLGGGLRLGTGLAGSKAGEYVLGKGGDWLDKQLHTKFLGTTGRILGGLGGWWGGSSATTPLFRSLAGKGITLHMPQETFANLRNQYFTNAENKALINLNSKSNPTLISTINHLYKEYPELSSIGPKEAYGQYYETIFPASKVQTPYVHGTKSDLSGGLETSVKVPNAAAPETIGRNDFYLNLQPETSLQYADGIGVPKGFTWNKHRFWPLKEILGKPYKSDAWMSKPIKLREQVPNRAGQFSRVKNTDGTYSGHGKLLEEYKAELGMQDLSNEEFLQRLGVQDEESFNQWVAKNRQMFSDIYDSGDYHGLYHVKIDANKPLTINGGNTYYSERGIWDRMNKGGNDVLLHNNAANEFGSDVAVVRDVTPQKVRILGSKPDQQGFADFIGGKQQFFTEIPTSPQEVATTYHFDGRMPLSRPISIAEKAGIPRGERPYLVDWTNWSKSTPISEKHLIEYSIIDNDLWRSKFKPFAGTDIRSHIQLRSKDAKKLDPRILFTGVEETIDPNYNGILWTTRDGLSARAYAPSDDKVMQIVIPKDAKINTYDANSNGWFEIDGKKMWDKGYRTNDFVNQSFDNGYDIAEIKRVIDIGPNYVPYSSKYNYFDNKLDFLERAPIQTDVVIKPGFPRKSVIGNNGDFDLSKQSLFEKQGGKIK